MNKKLESSQDVKIDVNDVTLLVIISNYVVNIMVHWGIQVNPNGVSQDLKPQMQLRHKSDKSVKSLRNNLESQFGDSIWTALS